MSEHPLPPIEYLLACPESHLEKLELAWLDRAAQILKHFKIELPDVADNLANATVARWFRDNREKLIEAVRQNVGADAKTILATLDPPKLPEPAKDSTPWRARWM